MDIEIARIVHSEYLIGISLRNQVQDVLLLGLRCSNCLYLVLDLLLLRLGFLPFILK